MAERLVVELTGIQGFNKVFDEIKEKKPVVFFSATKKEDGDPWCPDCKTADPVIESQVGELDSDIMILRVRVDRPYWKENTDNVFKKEHNIPCLPTLMRWGQPERLGEDECKSEEIVRAFLKKQTV